MKAIIILIFFFAACVACMAGAWWHLFIVGASLALVLHVVRKEVRNG